MSNKRRAGFGPAKKHMIALIVTILVFAVMGFWANAFTTQSIADQTEVVTYTNLIYEEQSDLKIDTLESPYEKTVPSENNQTSEEDPPVIEEELESPLEKKIERLKSEYAVAGQVYEYLNDQEIPDPAIAGILGNMMAECGGQTLDLQWGIYGITDPNYYGLCQWSLYYNPNVNGLDVTGQLDYLMSNVRTNMEYFGGDYDYFCTISDAGEAAKYFCTFYERGAGKSVRATNAVTAFAWIQAE